MYSTLSGPTEAAIGSAACRKTTNDDIDALITDAEAMWAVALGAEILLLCLYACVPTIAVTVGRIRRLHCDGWRRPRHRARNLAQLTSHFRFGSFTRWDQPLKC